MRFNKLLTPLAYLCTLALLSACSQGGFQDTLSSATGGESSQNTGGNSPGQNNSAFQKLDMTGYVDGGSYDKSFAFDIDKANNALIINVPIPAGPFTNVYLDVPDIKGAKIKTYVDTNGKPQVAISIPLHHVLRGVSTLPSQRLPNGNALPAMPSGEAPSLAFSLNNNSENKVHLYMGVNAVGLFIENSYIPEYLGVTLPIKNRAGTKILGYFTIVPKSGNFKGGLFVALPIPNEIAKIIDDHLSSLVQ